MKSILRRRPSPALVIACIALFVSMGGVSYGVATGFIDSREIKNNSVRSKDMRNNTLRTFDIRNNEIRGFDVRNSSIQGRDVAFNTLTGDDIAEEDLGQVPSAAAADIATRATTAGAVEGVTMRKISYLAEQGSGFVEVLNVGGLRLEARCATAPLRLEVQANPSTPNSDISSVFGSFTNDDPDFDPGDNTLVVDNAGQTAGQIAFGGADGAVVTVQALTQQELNGVHNSTSDCGFFGVAEAG